jgi:ABC-2 type transport system permease protein
MSTPAVAVSGLSKYFPQIELRHLLTGRRPPGVWALKEAAFELFPGEGLCITGPNGSGKTTLLVLLLTLLAHLPLGILAAAFILVFKQGDPVTSILGSLSGLLGGVYFPVAILPAWVQIISRFLPLTYSLEGLRQAVLNGKGISQLSHQILILAAFAVVLLPLSLAVFAGAVRQAKRLGTLSQF